ncbi:involucrin isoform X2 [Xyrichtys novacula]|uniref:Involucrin isoform X2 n=1 Tax=Xyrichtys novacula TaxID=13765 RepID=A0AAV1FR27_XYRNO|nr:involucrin isoform X2 [Xyrichtys novacula]
MTDCYIELIGLVILSLTLLISLGLNIFFCLKQKANLCKDTDGCCLPGINEEQRLSLDEGHYFQNANHREQQEENPHNHLEHQENPIYGNISTDRQGPEEVCYEMMTMQPTRDRIKASEADLNYASLDLRLAKKQKKRLRHQQQGRNSLQDQLPVNPANAFLEVEVDMDAHLPSRDTATMVSHSSIYLNSQQIAQEAEEMEREREISMEGENASWEGVRSDEEGRNTVWKGEEENEERIDFSNGNCCNGNASTAFGGSHINNFDGSFVHESVQQE